MSRTLSAQRRFFDEERKIAVVRVISDRCVYTVTLGSIVNVIGPGVDEEIEGVDRELDHELQAIIAVGLYEGENE